MRFREQMLDNGLQIIAECNDEVHTSAMGFFVKTGARDETDRLAGVSHFLEHMAFKGTPSRSADDVNREFDELGASPNAFTSQEMTVYHTPYLPEYQSQILEIWADCMRPSLREDDFDMEKKVILEEIQMSLDQPPYGAFDDSLKLHFGDHPLGRSVIGSCDSVSALSVADMRGYFQSRYSPRNITLAAAGRVDFEQLVAAAERNCGQWEPCDAARDVPAAPARHEKFSVDRNESSMQEYLLLLSDGPSAEDPRRYAAKLLATMLGDDSGSRLYWALIDSGMAEFVSLSHEEYQGAGLFLTYFGCQPEATKQTLDTVLDTFAKVSSEGFAADELRRAKSKITSRIVLASERPRSRLFSIGGSWIQRHVYRTVKQEIETYRNVTLGEVNQLATDFPLNESTKLAVGPLDKIG